MSINKKAQRLDLDTEENIYHLKVAHLTPHVNGTGTECGQADNLRNMVYILYCISICAPDVLVVHLHFLTSR